MDYCNGVEGFINYILSNPRNVSGDGIRCLCKRYKNKKFESQLGKYWKN